jgi:hypothetical protein
MNNACSIHAGIGEVEIDEMKGMRNLVFSLYTNGHFLVHLEVTAQ